MDERDGIKISLPSTHCILGVWRLMLVVQWSGISGLLHRSLSSLSLSLISLWLSLYLLLTSA